MFLATVFFAAKMWLVPVLVAFVAALVFIAWSYARSAGRAGVRALCAVMKLLGLAALLACLLEPMWSHERAKAGANVFAVIADNSRSLALTEPGANLSRGAEMREALAGGNSSWRSKLAENFEVRNYLADSRLRPTETFSEMNFDGRTSALGEALRQTVARHHGQALAGPPAASAAASNSTSEARCPNSTPREFFRDAFQGLFGLRRV